MKRTHATDALPVSHTRIGFTNLRSIRLDGYSDRVFEYTGFVSAPPHALLKKRSVQTEGAVCARPSQHSHRRLSQSLSDWGVVTAMALTMVIAVVGGMEFGLEVRQLNIAATVSAVVVLSLFAVVDEFRFRRSTQPRSEERSAVR